MDKNITFIINYYNFKKKQKIKILIKYILIFIKKFRYFFENFYFEINPLVRKKLYNVAWQSEINNYQKWFNRNNRSQLFTFKRNFFIASGGMTQRFWQYYVFKFLKEKQPTKVLEVGSGNGINLCLFSIFFDRIIFEGVDISDQGVKNSNLLKTKKLDDDFFQGWPIPAKRKKSNNINFYEYNAEKLKYKDKEFDFVYSILALEQMNDIKHKVIDEMTRVSSKYVCFVEPFIEYNRSLLCFLHHRGSKYFSYRINDLEKHKLKVIKVYDYHPNKVTLGVAAVLCKKI